MPIHSLSPHGRVSVSLVLGRLWTRPVMDRAWTSTIWFITIKGIRVFFIYYANVNLEHAFNLLYRCRCVGKQVVLYFLIIHVICNPLHVRYILPLCIFFCHKQRVVWKMCGDDFREVVFYFFNGIADFRRVISALPSLWLSQALLGRRHDWYKRRVWGKKTALNIELKAEGILWPGHLLLMTCQWNVSLT